MEDRPHTEAPISNEWTELIDKLSTTKNEGKLSPGVLIGDKDDVKNRIYILRTPHVPEQIDMLDIDHTVRNEEWLDYVVITAYGPQVIRIRKDIDPAKADADDAAAKALLSGITGEGDFVNDMLDVQFSYANGPRMLKFDYFDNKSSEAKWMTRTIIPNPSNKSGARVAAFNHTVYKIEDVIKASSNVPELLPPTAPTGGSGTTA